MKSKIRMFEQQEIIINNGVGEIHIAETTDGFNIRITENIDNSLRIGISNAEGIHFMYWKDIKEFLREKL